MCVCMCGKGGGGGGGGGCLCTGEGTKACPAPYIRRGSVKSGVRGTYRLSVCLSLSLFLCFCPSVCLSLSLSL